VSRAHPCSPPELEQSCAEEGSDPFRHTDENVYAYLAGIVDADGCITCSRGDDSGTFAAKLTVHQAEREAVDLFARTFGGTVKARPGYTPLARRETFMWYTTADNRADTLTRLLPHLRQKREQAELALEVIRLNQSWCTRPGDRRRPVEVTAALRATQERLATANDFGYRAESVTPPTPPETLADELPEEVSAYLAGVLDADGDLRVRKQVINGYVRFPVEVKLKQVTTDSIEVLQRYFGIKVRVETPSLPGGRHLLTWSCAARAAERLLSAVEPFMLIKKERANVLLECIRLNSMPNAAFEIPEVVPGEPLISLAEAAKRADVTYPGAAAARAGRIPVVRVKRSGKNAPHIFVPESFIEQWKARDHRRRSAAHVERQQELVDLCKKLNSRDPVV
jgi:hypothetical protein